MNWFPDFERKRAGFPPFAWRKAISWHVNMNWSGRDVMQHKPVASTSDTVKWQITTAAQIEGIHDIKYY